MSESRLAPLPLPLCVRAPKRPVLPPVTPPSCPDPITSASTVSSHTAATGDPGHESAEPPVPARALPAELDCGVDVRCWSIARSERLDRSRTTRCEKAATSARLIVPPLPTAPEEADPLVTAPRLLLLMLLLPSRDLAGSLGDAIRRSELLRGRFDIAGPSSCVGCDGDSCCPCL